MAADAPPAGATAGPVTPEGALAAAAAGEGERAAAMVLALARTQPTAQDAITLASAALDLDHPGLLRAATIYGIAAELPPGRRVHLAWRFALARKTDSALAVLLSDPGIATVPEVTQTLLRTLQIVVQNAPPQSVAQHQARALADRIVPGVKSAPDIATEVFPGDPASRATARGAPVTFVAAPGLPAVLSAEAAAEMAAFERQLPAAPFPRVRLYRDVFVNRYGQVWTEDGRAWLSKGMPIPPASRAAEAAAPRVPEAALGIETHNNMFHWLAEVLVSLAWRLEAAGEGPPILVRDDADTFVAESLARAAAGRVPTVPVGDAVRVGRLLAGDVDLRLLGRADVTGGMMRRLRGASGAAPREGAIYISRRDSRKRSIANEAVLEAALAARGIESVVMTGLPFEAQVARVDRAALVVAGHGAGLSLLAAAAPGLRVFEVVPALRGSLALRLCMARISRLVGHRHRVWLQPAPPAGAWSLPVEDVMAALDAFRAEPETGEGA